MSVIKAGNGDPPDSTGGTVTTFSTGHSPSLLCQCQIVLDSGDFGFNSIDTDMRVHRLPVDALDDWTLKDRAYPFATTAADGRATTQRAYWSGSSLRAYAPIHVATASMCTRSAGFFVHSSISALAWSTLTTGR